MQKPPPRPVQEGEGPIKGASQPPPDRRQVFANRGRTASSGSTRGAFGMSSDPSEEANKTSVPNVVYSGKNRKPDEEQGGNGGLPRDISNLQSGYGTNQKTIRDFAASPERQYYANVDPKQLEAAMGGHKSYHAVEQSPQRRNDDWASECESSQYTVSDEKFMFWKTYFYDPANPEFTSRQQTSWAVILGVIMGLFTAIWSDFIEWCIEVTWVKIPKLLLHLGLFTDLDGYFPLPHYMWVCPAIYGGVSVSIIM